MRDVVQLVRTLPLITALRLEDRERARLDANVRAHADRARRAAVLGSIASALPMLLGAPMLAATLLGALVLVLVRLLMVASVLLATWSASVAAAGGHRAVSAALGAVRQPPLAPRVGTAAPEPDPSASPPAVLVEALRTTASRRPSGSRRSPDSTSRSSVPAGAARARCSRCSSACAPPSRAW